MNNDTVPAAEALKKFRIIFAAVRQHFRAVEKACGVSGAQVWVLAALAGQSGMRVTELARQLSIHQSTASNLLHKTEKAGLVKRTRSQKDQRVVELDITDAGRAVLDKAPKPYTGLLPHTLNEMSEADLAGLNDSLNKVIGHMIHVDVTAAEQPLSKL